MCSDASRCVTRLVFPPRNGVSLGLEQLGILDGAAKWSTGSETKNTKSVKEKKISLPTREKEGNENANATGEKSGPGLRILTA
jgi:hypothetical protein